MKKSPKERFLLIIGILFFFVYLFMGFVVIFWDVIFVRNFPIAMLPVYRVAFGVILIVYSFLRFYRFFNSNND
jgi:undecaprenyl pyrophosphate phosphatase UppP